jgi:cell division protein FtsL
MRDRSKRRRLRVVRAVRRPRLPFLVVAFFLVGALVFGVVTLQALVSQTSFKMQELTTRSADLQESYGRLTLEVAELSSPARIARQAAQLGFHVPADGQIHTLPVHGPADANRGESRTAPHGLGGTLGERP